MLVLLFGLVSSAFAQQPVEAAFVRGHFSYGDGIWRADDFGWFYYDLDKDQGGEELRIDVQERVAEKGNIVYSSKTWTSEFEYEPWGSFQEIGILGKPYLAGYPDCSFTDEISSLGKGELRMVLINEERTQTLSYNKTLALQQGYVLVAAEVSEKKGTVNFVLLKNGEIVYASLLSIGDTFVYKINDIPVILVHLADAMQSGIEGFAEVDGIFQVSDAPIVKLFEGALIGNMKLNTYSEEGMEFENNISVTLKRDSEVPLTPDFKLVVLDQPDLAYYPVGSIFDYGVHEIRGPTFTTNSSIPVNLGNYNSTAMAKWNTLNYSGFSFDPEKGLGREALVLYNIDGKTVWPPSSTPVLFEENNTAIQEGFQYTTMVQAKDFDFESWGHYFVINFLGMQWFAGYDSSLEGGSSTKSLLENEYLGQVVIDTEILGKVVAGNYSLAEDYEMRIRDVSNDSLFIELLKQGKLVDSSVVKSNTTYIYKKDLENINDMPIIMMHFGNVFNSGIESFATLDGIFQISERNIIEIEPERGIGELEIVEVGPDAIIMINLDPINLNRNSNVNIGPGMDIRVADNDTLRFYLYTTQYVVPAPEPPLISSPGNATPFTAANFSLMVKAAEISQINADILDANKRTVFSKDITKLGQGSGDTWIFAWKWNATTVQMSDDKSLVLDADGSPVPGLLYLSPTTPPLQVSVIFETNGRIGAIMDGASAYYVSRNEYDQLNSSLDYGAMLANDTARTQFIKIEPGKSILQFLDIIDGVLAPSGINHTLQGNLEAIEPHATVVGAKPGLYELRVRVENAVNAVWATDVFISVNPGDMRGVSLGNAAAFAGEDVSIPLLAPKSNIEKRINISYDAAKLKATGISGECKATWQVDAKRGRIGVLLPAGCGAANLTFAVSRKNQVNDTIDLDVIGTSGFKPETISNGTITIASEKGAKESHALGFLASIVALAAGAYARRRK